MKSSFLKKSYPIWVIAFISILFVMPQILNRSIIFGADVPFHFNRIYDIYMQIKTHNFSLLQTNYGFNQTGRIINALYGPGFAFILGGILSVLHSWLKFQIVTSFIIFMTSGTLMYKLSYKLGAKKKFALISAILFMSSYWISSWVTVESFMAWGTMLMPLIVMVGLDMINYDENGLSIVKLAMALALVTQVHVLSALFSAGVVLVFFIVGMIRNKQKIQLAYKTVIAGALYLILTFNVWGAMLEVFTSNSIITPFPVRDMSKETVNLSIGKSSIYEVGLILSVVFLVQIIYIWQNRSKFSINNVVMTSVGAVFLLLSSNLIPWTLIGNKFVNLQNMLQFPYRFMTMASVLLIATISVTLSKIDTNSKITWTIFTVGALLLSMQIYEGFNNSARVWFNNWPIATGTPVIKTSKFTANEFRRAMKSSDLSQGLKLVTKGYPDYLPTNSKKEIFKSVDPYAEYSKEVIFNQKNFHKSVKGDKLIISWNSKKRENINVPVIVYSRSSFKLNGKKMNHAVMKLSKIGVPTVKSRIGKNTISLTYRSALINKMTVSLVLLVWILCIILIIFRL